MSLYDNLDSFLEETNNEINSLDQLDSKKYMLENFKLKWRVSGLNRTNKKLVWENAFLKKKVFTKSLTTKTIKLMKQKIINRKNISQMTVERLINQIIKNKFHPFRKWSEINKSGRSFYNFKNDIKKLLSIISGGENQLFEMLHSFSGLLEIYFDNKYKTALLNIGSEYQKLKPKERHPYIKCLKNAGLTRQEAINIGFKCSTKLWLSCDNTEKRNKGGRKKLSDEKIKSINSYLETVSNISSNRTIKSKTLYANGNKEIIPVQNITIPLTEAYFKYQNKDQVSFSTFYKYIDKLFKKAHRLTDLCDYCELGKEQKSIILKEAKTLGYAGDDNFVLIKDFVINECSNQNEEKQALLKKTFEILDEVEYHRDIASRQRKSYNSNRSDKDLLLRSIVIELDFKQKIVIGSGPRQMNKDFYNQIQKHCLGFGIYFYDTTTQTIDCINVDFISDLNQDAFFVVQAFRKLREEQFFKDIDKQNYVIWTDCGSTFRCSELSHYYFTELAEKDITVNLNFFAEKHGKSARDQHFSVISKYIQEEMNVKRITCSNDIVQCLINRQDQSNFINLNSNRSFVHLEVLLLNHNTACQITRQFRDISNITTYYNLQNVCEFRNNIKQYTLKSSIFSDENDLIEIDSSYNAEERVKIKPVDERTVKKQDASVIHLKKKRMFTQMLQQNKSKNSNNINSSFIAEESTNTIPLYCKNECAICNVNPAYTLDQLTSVDKIGQKLIINELVRHNHPSSRILSKNRQRNTGQALNELIKHYEYKHYTN